MDVSLHLYDDQGNIVAEKKCPFCRTPDPTSNEEIMERFNKRVELEDPLAIYSIGCYYHHGTNGYPVDNTKALELYHQTAELGYAKAYNGIGYAYEYGEGVEVDKEKAAHYYELAAIGGNAVARHNLGCVEKKRGNLDRALKHYIIAVGGGYAKSLKRIQSMYNDGYATKEDYSNSLQVYQTYLGEIKSVQRDKAAVADDQFRYY